MTQVLKQTGWFLAMILVLVPLAAGQRSHAGPANAEASDAGSSTAAADSESLREAAQPMGFWVGTTIQGRMWNHDPDYKPVMGREFNAGVSIVFQGIRSRSGDGSISIPWTRP